jgi:hypothetical protein
LHPAHRAVTPKLDEPLISVHLQEIKRNLDLCPSHNSNLALDALFAIRFASVPDEERLDPIGSDGHR